MEGVEVEIVRDDVTTGVAAVVAGAVLIDIAAVPNPPPNPPPDPNPPLLPNPEPNPPPNPPPKLGFKLAVAAANGFVFAYAENPPPESRKKLIAQQKQAK